MLATTIASTRSKSCARAGRYTSGIRQLRGGVRKVYHAWRFGVPIQSRQRPSMNLSVRILGLDPGLRRTGWGVIECAGNRLSYIACGVVETNDKHALALRLPGLHRGVRAGIGLHAPHWAAVGGNL